MAVRKLKPNTPGQRHKVARSFDEVTTSSPEKSLLVKQKRTGGRNDRGKMTIRHVGGDTNSDIELLILKEINSEYPQKLLLSNMIRTEQHILLFYIILMVKKNILFLLKD